MSAQSTGLYKADILVVDDTPANLQLLTQMLKERGYKVRPAPNGTLALAAARSSPPDLILLDITMPGISGYEVAEELKRDTVLRDVPIIFLSALNETLDKVRAFAAGGVDYITKPFQFEEVEARVATHLKLRRMHLELEARNLELRNRNEELRRLQELRDNLTNMIVHDLRSPLTVVVASLELLADDIRFGEPVDAEGTELIAQARASTSSIIGLVSSVLDVCRMESGQMELHRDDFDAALLARDVLAAFESLRGNRLFVVQAPVDTVALWADRDLLFRVLQNLVGNAIKFVPDSGAIRIAVQPTEASIRISVSDTGPGIPLELHDRIFEKFGQATKADRSQGTGLGLTFCKLAVEAHGGTIRVCSEPGEGATFTFEIPINLDASPTMSVTEFARRQA